MRDGLGSLRVKPGRKSVYCACTAKALGSVAHTEVDDEWKPAASTSLVTSLCEEQVRMNILVHGDSGDVEHAGDSLLFTCQPEPNLCCH